MVLKNKKLLSYKEKYQNKNSSTRESYNLIRAMLNFKNRIYIKQKSLSTDILWSGDKL